MIGDWLPSSGGGGFGFGLCGFGFFGGGFAVRGGSGATCEGFGVGGATTRPQLAIACSNRRARNW